MKVATILLAAAAGVSAVTTTLPKSAGVTSLPTAIPVKGSYDGKMKRFERSPSTCQEQKETGEKDASFILEDGATLSNVIIGASSGEGVHCRGKCTLNNVWWADVCEDAATFKMSSGVSTVNGGGAFKAADKVFQFNGKGTLNINDFYVNDYGKLTRNCGNCKNNGGPRNINIKGVVAKNGGELCGVNQNYGDVCTISNSCQDKNKSCAAYQGNSSGKEPTKLSTGHNGKSCILKNFTKC
ncbi:family 3 polysaccharide lyase [Plectosphaerella cucumerina]|uniref:Pectate lyase n=1 Tax=Plectosphaerella cucumerina TaxID=40658 RepID=A0A8K0TNF4_9PEZI|nr:family 3 polysaccharide lyase [Plectosphaerella cucumerina]